ncbi:MAG TPA: arylsulfatase [Opitutaceae bacterium]|jgi:arylsulfatase A-like enzyme|nr:arylsulfatase [Opitutaceae bacterium]HRE05056.1 arylsulfatase [Opitutaceae bacterium]
MRRLTLLLLGILSACSLCVSLRAVTRPPNIVFILADDLGYGDLGCYGQDKIATPHLDRMAKEGLRFTRFYAGSTVCAPSRSVTMTGQHTGHTTVRGNAGVKGAVAQTLRAEDVTVAEVLQAAGYRTALVGKWGLGEADSVGAPWLQGFDEFFGFLNQTHAHNHFPDHLFRRDRRVPLRNDLVPAGTTGAGYATRRVDYANDLFFDEGLTFLGEARARPFFLYLALTVPHANNERSRLLGDGQEVPDYGSYADRPWSPATKGQAAMISRMDEGVGRVLARLRELGLDENTLVLFSSDNGPHREGGPGYDPAFFNASGGLRGIKRDLTEGGIRVPLIARWPGRVPAGVSTARPAYQGDLFATFAELAGAPAPTALDSISLVPSLHGRLGDQREHEFLYWEFYERTYRQAVIWQGRWKGIRTARDQATFELYDLANDPAETRNVASSEVAVVTTLASQMDTAHRPTPHWSFPSPSVEPKSVVPTSRAP